MGEKEKGDQYSFLLNFCREIIANYIFLLYSQTWDRDHTWKKIKSIQKTLCKGNNNLNRRTLAGRRDLEGHQESSKDNDIGQKLDTALQSNKTVRLDADTFAVFQSAGVRSGMGSRQNPMDHSYSTASGMRLSSAVSSASSQGS